MRRDSDYPKAPAEKVVKDIRRATRRRYNAEEKIRIVVEGLRGEDSIAALCRREGISIIMVTSANGGRSAESIRWRWLGIYERQREAKAENQSFMSKRLESAFPR